MANFNRIVLLGRLTRDPESRTFANGGKVTKFGFAASPARKKNTANGQWEDEPMFIDCEVYNRGEFGKLADLVGDKCRKGSQIMIEGKLHLDQWEDKNGGGKRSKHKVVVDTVQLLDPRPQDGGGGRSGGGYSSGGGGDPYAGGGDDYGAPPSSGSSGGGNAPQQQPDDIPF